MQSKWLTYSLRAGSWLLLLFSIGWTLWYVFAGYGNPMDPFYWLYKYRTLEAGWMSAGTILAGAGWVRLFGAELLPLRILGWLCVACAIILPYLCLLSKEERSRNIHWLAIAFALMNYGAFQEFSPGTLTVLILAACWILLVIYRRREQSKGFAIALGALAGLAIFVRFPNILVVPVLLVAMSLREGKWISWRMFGDRLAMVLSCVVVALTGYAIAHYLLVPTYSHPAMGSSHMFGDMLNGLWMKGAMIVGMALLWGGIWTIGYAVQQYIVRWRPWCIIGAGIIAGGLIGYYITFVPAVGQWYNYDVTYMVSAFCLLLAVLTRRWEALWGIAVLVVASLGTDTGWLKLFPIVLCLVPFAATCYDSDWRRYLWPVAVGLAVTVMVRFSVNSVGESNLRYANTPATITPYKGIRLQDSEIEWMEQVKADYDSICSQGEVLALGMEMHRIREITGCKAAYYNEFWSNLYDPVYTKMYREVAQNERPIFLCSYASNFKSKAKYKPGFSAVEEMLIDEGYRVVDRSKYKYKIYIPEP